MVVVVVSARYCHHYTPSTRELSFFDFLLLYDYFVFFFFFCCNLHLNNTIKRFYEELTKKIPLDKVIQSLRYDKGSHSSNPLISMNSVINVS